MNTFLVSFTRVAALAVGLVVSLIAHQAMAQSSASSSLIVNPERVIPFAKSVERELASQGARVAIVARVGRDPEGMPDGIEYTHVAFWVYSDIETADGKTVRGYAIHNLYQEPDDAGRSFLTIDYPAPFFGEVFDLRAGVIIPTPQVQEKLLRIIASPTYKSLHNPNYSLVANPFRDDDQNCTNFVLRNLVAAIYGTDDKAQITANIAAHFTPQRVGLSGLQRAFGPLFVDGFETSDHDGPIRTSTFGALGRFMDKYGMTQTQFEVDETAEISSR